MSEVVIKKPSKVQLLELRKKVIGLRKKGMPVMQIVAESGLSWPAVNAVIKLYEAGGIKALVPAKRGRKIGNGRALSEEHEQELRTILYRKRPWQAKVKASRSLWCRESVLQLIQQQCGVTLTPEGVAKYLKRWGFPPMKKQPPKKRCSREIQGWLKKHYAEIERQYKNGSKEVFWVSKIGMTGDGSSRLSKISAIDNRGKEYWLVIKGQFTPAKQVAFLNSLAVESRRKPVVMIRSNADHFTGWDVNVWLKHTEKSLELVPPQLLPGETKKKKVESAKVSRYREKQRSKKGEGIDRLQEAPSSSRASRPQPDAAHSDPTFLGNRRGEGGEAGEGGVAALPISRPLEVRIRRLFLLAWARKKARRGSIEGAWPLPPTDFSARGPSEGGEAGEGGVGPSSPRPGLGHRLRLLFPLSRGRRSKMGAGRPSRPRHPGSLLPSPRRRKTPPGPAPERRRAVPRPCP